VVYGNNRQMAMGYAPNRQQPTSMKVDRVGNPADKIIDYVYNYYDLNGKNNGRILKVTDNIDPTFTTDYSYDNYNRLASAQVQAGAAYSRFYSYDRWGNITNFSGATFSYATNASGAPATNRISGDGCGNNYGYDAAGNLTQIGTTTYGYDGAGRLKSVNGAANSYGYDGNGGRVRVTEGDGAAPVFYVRSSVLGQAALEVNATGVRRAYVYAGKKLVAEQSTDGQFYWLHTNHLGSSRAMTDVNGNLVYKGQFDPYGQVLTEWSSSGNTNLNAKKFTGYERDAATGLDYAGARMYNSGRGRFMQPDPNGIGAANLRLPESLNRYSYVRNDPVNHIDPLGTDLISATCYWVGSWGDEESGFTDFYACSVDGPAGGGPEKFGGGSGGEVQGGGGQPAQLVELDQEIWRAMSHALNELADRLKLEQISENCRNNVLNKLVDILGLDVPRFTEFLTNFLQRYHCGALQQCACRTAS
jgi:RHS repeat-associated protein